MPLVLPADVQQRVNALLGTGRYTSEEEILRAAVAVPDEQDADLTAIQGGINDRESGRYRPFAAFDAAFREQIRLTRTHEFPRCDYRQTTLPDD
jgi:Arc/MetJ-type ribon-helix-helix transcriptional regulator